MTTLRDILTIDPNAVWSDGTLWHETAGLLAGWDDATLDQPAVERDRILYLLAPNGCEVGGFALQRLGTAP